MARFNFCGGTYQSVSPNISAELAMNLYPEAVESAVGRSAMALLQTPGLAPFAELPAGSQQSVLGLETFFGRTFAVGVVLATSLMHLYEVNQNGTLTDRGSLGAPVTNAPAIWAANPNQVVFTVGGTGSIYVFTLKTNVITSYNTYADVGGTFAAASVNYVDGFFQATLQNSNMIQVSALEDGTVWNAINVATVSEFADPIVSTVVNQRIVWLLGQKASVPYYNAGALFPLVPIPGAFIEEGSIATYGAAKLDNTLLWIGGNVDQGIGIAWRMNGYTPQRISTHAVETAWQNYPTIADAQSYTYQSGGHKFWVIYFPSANATWVYDVSTSLWHQRGTWNAAIDEFTAHRSCCHTFNFGKHLVGDPLSGNIYAMSDTVFTENGQNVRRVRRAPYIAKEHEDIFHRSLELLLESGLQSAISAPSDAPIYLYLADPTGAVWQYQISDGGNILPGQPSPAGQLASRPILADNVTQTMFFALGATTGGIMTATNVPYGRSDFASYRMSTNNTFLDCFLQVSQGGVISVTQPLPHQRAPQIDLRWSDDGAHTWSSYRTQSIGLTGEFQKRVRFQRLGKSRNRIYEMAFNDPVALRVVDAYVKTSEDQAVERFSQLASKQA